MKVDLVTMTKEKIINAEKSSTKEKDAEEDDDFSVSKRLPNTLVQTPHKR